MTAEIQSALLQYPVNGERQWLSFEHPIFTIVAEDLKDVPNAIRSAQSAAEDGYWVVGNYTYLYSVFFVGNCTYFYSVLLGIVRTFIVCWELYVLLWCVVGNCTYLYSVLLGIVRTCIVCR